MTIVVAVLSAIVPSVSELAAPVLCRGAIEVETRTIRTEGRRGNDGRLAVTDCTMPGDDGAETFERRMNPIVSLLVLVGYGTTLVALVELMVTARKKWRARATPRPTFR